MEKIELPRMAAALSCPPRTLCRLLYGLSAARSLRKAVVSLDHAGPALNMEEVLSQFLEDVIAGKDEALDPFWARTVADVSKATFNRRHKEGVIPAIIHVGRFVRFSSNAVKRFAAEHKASTTA